MFCYLATQPEFMHTFNGINVFNILPEMIHDIVECGAGLQSKV